MRRWLVNALDAVGRAQTLWSGVPKWAQALISGAVMASAAWLLAIAQSIPWAGYWLIVLASFVVGGFVPHAVASWRAYSKIRSALPVRIEAPSAAVTTGRGNTPSQRAMRWVDCHVHMLNLSKQDRVSLVLDPITCTPHAGKPWSFQGGVRISAGMKLNLGPQEETAGVVTFYVPDNSAPFDLRFDRVEIGVTDRISGRASVLRLPGGYPP